MLPVFTIEAAGSAGNYGSLDELFPALQAVNSGRADIALPVFTLQASGYATVTATYAGYAVNLMAGEDGIHQATQYTNLPFNQILRWGNDYYGIGDNGIYLLGGETDYNSVTPTAIPWSFETGLTRFGSAQMKVCRESLTYGRVGPGLNATATVAEGTAKTYDAIVQAGGNAQATRAKYGRGLKAVYWGFGYADPDGGPADIDSQQYDAAELTRKVF